MSHYLKKIVETFTQQTRECLYTASTLAAENQHYEVGIEHMLLALMEHQPELWERLSVSCGLRVTLVVNELKLSMRVNPGGCQGSPLLSAELISFFEQTWLHASINWGHHQLTPAALLACLLKRASDHTFLLNTTLLNTLNCQVEAAETLLCNASRAQIEETDLQVPKDDQSGSAIQQYTRNLTELAREGMLDPTPGREPELRLMIDILLRRRQNNPILTGEAGVGKTALVEGLAQRIASGTVPDRLKSMTLLTLDLGLLQAGASVKGEFEKRLQALLREIKALPVPVILFIDEAHMLIGAGGQAGQNDAANLLKPALARGELRAIAATTWAEYKKYFEKDAALARRFEVIKVAEPDTEMATHMLRSLAPAISAHHGIIIQESALQAAVKLSQRYITGRVLPDKSVTLLDTACARVAVSQSHQPKEIEDLQARLSALEEEQEGLNQEGGREHKRRLKWIVQCQQDIRQQLVLLTSLWQSQCQLVANITASNDAVLKAQWRSALAASHQQQPLVFEYVDDVCVADIVAGWTGIPLGRVLQKQHLSSDEIVERLERRVIGQSHALKEIATQLRIVRANLHDPFKPCGVYMLAGPSGVGKTETALALADIMYGGEQSLITINLSEYQEPHSVSGLKGSPPGYIGYGQGGVLTEAVRRRPYSVILLDEAEKAHPDVMQLFYQVFDKGFMEDAEGVRINFRNTFIIMTSNLASDLLMAHGNSDITDLTRIIRPEFDRVFRPALMGRIKLIPYLPVQGEILESIIRLKMDRLIQRVVQTGTENQSLSYQPEVVSYIASRCQVVQSGARDIDAVLGQEILPVLAESLLTTRSGFGKRLLALNNERIVIKAARRSERGGTQ